MMDFREIANAAVTSLRWFFEDAGDWLIEHPARVMLALLAAALVAFVILFARPARAVQLDRMGCLSYAAWSYDVVWAREVGADKEKVRVSLIEMTDSDDSGVLRLVLLDFERLWTTREPRRAVSDGVMRDCAARRGRYGEAT